MQRNEILRTRLVQGPNGKDYLVVLKECFESYHIEDVDEEGLLASGDSSRLVMDYGQPLSRWSVLQGGKTVVWAISHVIYDGWSLPLILSDFAEAWKLSSNTLGAGQGLRMSPRPSFKGFIKYLTRKRKENWGNAAGFWRSELLSAGECVQFPRVNVNGHTPTTSAAYTKYIPVSWLGCPSLSQKPLCKTSIYSPGVLHTTYLWAAWAMVLWKHTESSNVLFGATLNGRRYPIPGIEAMTGPTITTIPIMIGMDREMTVEDFLQYLQRKANTCAEYGWMGLQDILGVCDRDKLEGKVNSIMVVQPTSGPEEGGGLFDTMSQQTGWAFDESRSSTVQHNIGICLICSPSDSGLTIDLQYDPNLQTHTEIEWIVGQFTTALEQLLHTDTQATQLGKIRLSGDDEIKQIQSWNSKSLKPVNECLHDLFDARARVTGDAEAIFSAHGSVSYKQLDDLSRDLAKFLHNKGLGRETMVPIAFENSWLAVVAVLAVLRAGACFVPIHPSTPRERMASILRQVDAKLLVCSESLYALIKNYEIAGIELLELSGLSLASISSSMSKANVILPKVSPSSLAYIYFTSGSTGVPKGVCMSHRASSTGNTAYTKLLSLTPSSRVLQFASLSFDVSCLEIFSTLLSGGCVCIPSPEDRLQHLHAAIQKLRCNVLVLTPTVAKLLQVDYARDPIPIDTLCLTGEPLTASDVDFWAPRTRLYNGYGPTETCFCTFSRALSRDSSAGNIGYGAGCNTWVVDETGIGLAPLGTKGELFIQGPIVADGYLGDPEKTRRSFVEDPPWRPDGWSEAGRKFVTYRTGDTVRYNNDGSLEYFGRRDAQIKVRGMRIDLGEVESAVSSLGHKAVVLFPADGPAAGNITAVVAFGHCDGTGSLQILSEPEPDSEIVSQLLALRRQISSLIPTYMHPTVWVPVDSLPMLTSAKVSRLAAKQFVTQQLQKSWLDSWNGALNATDLKNSVIQPEETMAVELAGIVDKLVGMGDGYRTPEGGKLYQDIILSRAGIDSIKAIQLIRLLSKRYKITPAVGKILGSEMSIRGLARYVEDLQTHPGGMEHATAPGVDLVEEYHGLADILQEQFADGKRPSRLSDTISTVFMTGATGYLGIEILHQLLEHQEISTIITLVRAPSLDKARNKLIAAAGHMGWALAPHLPKIEIWLGDLSLPNLGLSPAHWDHLRGHHRAPPAPRAPIDAIIHVGATVDWTRSYHQLKPVNVSSTLALLTASTHALRRTGRRPRFVHVSGGRQPAASSLFGAPLASGTCWEAEGLRLARALSSSSAPGTLGYTQTKLLSDLLVCKWASLLLPGGGGGGAVEDSGVRVVIPGFVIGGGPNAVANMDDVLWRLVRTNIGLGMYNSSEVENRWVYLASSAAAARSALRGGLSLAPPSSAAACLLSEEEEVHETEAMSIPILDGMPERAFWSLISRSGYPLAGTPHDEWLAAVEADVEAQGVKHPLYPVLHFVNQGVGIGGELPGRDPFEGAVGREARAEVERDVVANLAYMRRMGFLKTAAASDVVNPH